LSGGCSYEVPTFEDSAVIVGSETIVSSDEGTLLIEAGGVGGVGAVMIDVG
jgi:hypothetical protein